MIPDRDKIATLSIIELITLADQLEAAGQKESSLELYQEWINLNDTPLRFIANFNLGVLLTAHNEPERAMEAYNRSLELNPDFMQARMNLGTLLEQSGQKDEALEQWRLALLSREVEKPENKSLRLLVINNIGRLLEIKREYKTALATLEESLSLDPAQYDVMLHLSHLAQKICRWPIYAPLQAVTKEELFNGTSPLALLAVTDDPEAQLTITRRFVNYKFPVPVPDREPLAPRAGYNHDRIRIAYLSSNLSTHAVSLLTVELFELHDRQKFEVFGFCWSPEDYTAFRQRVIKGFDHFIQIGTLSDQDAAELIRSHEIDILVDLQGLTSGARPIILSYRPAPLQLTYLGFPGPTALPWIDYVIADRYMIPEAEANFYTEKPLYLPYCFQSSDSKREVGPLPRRSDYGLPEAAFVFCSFNHNYKYTPEMFSAWMRILKGAPKSVLWLLADNEWAKENLLDAARKMGIKKERLIFAPRAVPPEYLARYQLADLFLDTYPFNGGTTANDALFMGLPLLTLSGRTFASRYAGSLLTHLGLPELITNRLCDYEKKAVKLATKPGEIGRLKKVLRERKTISPVFDMTRFTKDYEAALEQTLQVHCHSVAEKYEISRPIINHVASASIPYFSIVISTHKRPQLLERSLSSVCRQSFRDVEIIVVADSSDPATFEVAGRYLSERDIFIKRSGVPGPAASRNLGMGHAKGQYLIFLDDDDSFDAGYLEKLWDACEKNRNVVLYCNFHVEFEDRQTVPVTKLSEQFIDISSFSIDNLYVKNFVPNLTVTYPRMALEGKRFDTHLKLNEDWDFLLNVLDDVGFKFIDMSGPRMHKDDAKLLNRRGTRNHDSVLIDLIHVYRRWPGKTREIKLERQRLLQVGEMNVPVEWL